jgi:hypothetical protein
LVDKVETNRSYGKSDALQVIRILKNYDLLRDTQLDLPTGERSGRLRAEASRGANAPAV